MMYFASREDKDYNARFDMLVSSARNLLSEVRQKSSFLIEAMGAY